MNTLKVNNFTIKFFLLLCVLSLLLACNAENKHSFLNSNDVRMIKGKVILPSNSQLSLDQLFVSFLDRKVKVNTNGEFTFPARKSGATDLFITLDNKPNTPKNPANPDNKKTNFLMAKVTLAQDYIEISSKSTAFTIVDFGLQLNGMVDNKDYLKALELANTRLVTLTAFLDKELSSDPYYFADVVNFFGSDKPKLNNTVMQAYKDIQTIIQADITAGKLSPKS